MPTYDYYYPICGYIDSVLIGLHEEPLFRCPVYGEIMKRKMSAPAFVMEKRP